MDSGKAAGRRREGFTWGAAETATRWAVTIPYPSASDDFKEEILRQAAESDLVILGTQRGGRKRTLGRVALGVARATRGGVILISHRRAPGAALAARF